LFDIIYFDNVSIKQVSGFPSPSVDYPTDAYKLVESGSNGVHAISNTFLLTSITDHTYSFYIKEGGRTKIGFYESAVVGIYITFDLSTNSIIDNYVGASGEVIDIVNGWKRVSFTFDSGNGILIPLYILDDSYASGNPLFHSYTGDGTSGIYIYGAQLEEGSYPTSYIQSEAGGTVTRVADAITGAGDATLFSSVNSSGVLYWEGSMIYPSSINIYMSLSDGTSSNRILVNPTGALNILQIRIYCNGSNVYDQSVNVGDLTVNKKIAISWKTDEFKVYYNGGLVGTIITTGDTFPTSSTLNRFNFSTEAGSGYFSAKTRQVAVYNYLTDAQCISLTT